MTDARELSLGERSAEDRNAGRRPNCRLFKSPLKIRLSAPLPQLLNYASLTGSHIERKVTNILLSKNAMRRRPSRYWVQAFYHDLTIRANICVNKHAPQACHCPHQFSIIVFKKAMPPQQVCHIMVSTGRRAHG